MLAPFERQGSRQILHRGARGSRMGEVGHPPSRAEPDEDDDALAVGDHRAHGDRSREVPSRVDGQSVHRSPALEGDLLGRGDELPARVVHEHVDVPEALERLLDERFNLLGLADIGLNGQASITELLLHRGDGFLAPAADRDPRPGAHELARDRAADSGPAAGDERHLAFVGVRGQWGVEVGHGTRASTGRRPSSASRTATAGRR